MLTLLFYPLTFLTQNMRINKEKPQNHYDSEVIFWQRVKDSNRLREILGRITQCHQVPQSTAAQGFRKTISLCSVRVC